MASDRGDGVWSNRGGGARGAQLIAFPESFVPGFPVWAWCRPPSKITNISSVWRRIRSRCPAEVAQLSAAAREHEIVVSIGVSERSPVSVGCLWNTNLLIGADGALLNHHRKLVPTFYEKLIWANGDGVACASAIRTFGKLGMLICGENTNPLARYALIAQGEQVHVSSYPPVWPTRPANEPGRYDLASAIKIRAGAHRSKARYSISSRLDFSISVPCEGWTGSMTKRARPWREARAPSA